MLSRLPRSNKLEAIARRNLPVTKRLYQAFIDNWHEYAFLKQKIDRLMEEGAWYSRLFSTLCERVRRLWNNIKTPGTYVPPGYTRSINGELYRPLKQCLNTKTVYVPLEVVRQKDEQIRQKREAKKRQREEAIRQRKADMAARRLQAKQERDAKKRERDSEKRRQKEASGSNRRRRKATNNKDQDRLVREEFLHGNTIGSGCSHRSIQLETTSCDK
jgi:hypothetical protein